MENLTPQKIVEELDKYIIGQDDAKKSVAIALRNRYRRSKLSQELRDEISPKNILMIGPTGVGKTEIARRLARLVQAPFIKVEATKYTEVGYVGRDVESMVRDLVEMSIRMTKSEKVKSVEPRSRELAIERLIDLILQKPRKVSPATSPFNILFGGMPMLRNPQAAPPEQEPAEEEAKPTYSREELGEMLRKGELNQHLIEIETDESLPSMIEVFTASGMEEMGVNFQELLGGFLPKRKKRRRVRVEDAIKIFAQEEADKLIDLEEVKREAISKAEQHGIIFIDEMDKIAGREKGHGPDVSREGVQRDILPIVEGSTVMTKYGPVRTDYILFIAAGAFNVSKPSDLIPELQGRFPIRVELKSLTKDDFVRILQEPQNALIKQYAALLDTEGVKLEFSDDGIEELALIAQEINAQTENIGARRLHTILEKVLEDISFTASELEGKKIIINKDFVQQRLEGIVKDEDLTRFIL
jgi:ATP-dependent HslUV protease ATP-binding subunit HslU